MTENLRSSRLQINTLGENLLWPKEQRRTFTAEFKQQMVQLYQNGKPRKDIIREYDLTPSSLDKWVSQSQTSGSFKEKDNRNP